MRKHIIQIIALSVIVGFICNTKAQSHLSKGIKGGINLSTVNSNVIETKGLYTGLVLGGYLNLLLNERFSFQFELLLARRGWHSETGYRAGYLEYLGFIGFATMNYIEMPLLIGYSLESVSEYCRNFQLSPITKLGFFVGPSIGVFLNGKWKSNSNRYILTGSGYEIVEETKDSGNINGDDVDRLDFSLMFGAYFSFYKITIDIRYSFGLTNFMRDDTPLYSFNGGYEYEATHRVGQLIIGYLF